MSTLRLAAVALAVITVLVYAFTQAPGLYYTDTGELAAAAHVWGVAHPTGYPLFTMLAHVWTLLPWPSTILGLNLFAAVLVSGASATLFLLIERLVRAIAPSLPQQASVAVAIAGAGLFAFAPTVWAQTTAIEVYSLQTLLLSLTLLFTLQARSGDVRSTALSGLFFGLMLSNHLSSVFLAPGFLLLWWSGRPGRQDQLRDLRWLLIPSLLGPSLYALLPLRSAALPPINWGMVHRGWDAFLYHVKGTQFGVWMFSDEKAMRDNASLFLSLSTDALLIVGWLAVVGGLVVLFRKDRGLVAGLLTILAGNLAISLGYAIPDIDAYFLPSLLILSLLAAVGLIPVMRRLKGPAMWSVAAAPLIAFALNVGNMDHREHRAVEAYVQWTLANVEPNAIVLTRQWDFLCSAFWYAQTVEGIRPDVVMIDKELLRRTWYAPFLTQRYPDAMNGAQAALEAYRPWLESFERDHEGFMEDRQNPAEIQRRFVDVLNAIITSHPDRPVYFTPELIGEEQGVAVGYDALPVGPLLRITRDSSLRPVTSLDHVDELVTSLEGRSGRLDDALRSTTLTALATNALYAAQVLGDRARFEDLLEPIRRLDPSGRYATSLQRRVGQ